MNKLTWHIASKQKLNIDLPYKSNKNIEIW